MPKVKNYTIADVMNGGMEGDSGNVEKYKLNMKINDDNYMFGGKKGRSGKRKSSKSEASKGRKVSRKRKTSKSEASKGRKVSKKRKTSKSENKGRKTSKRKTSKSTRSRK